MTLKRRHSVVLMTSLLRHVPDGVARLKWCVHIMVIFPCEWESNIVITIVVDVLATQGARASAAMELLMPWLLALPGYWNISAGIWHYPHKFLPMQPRNRNRLSDFMHKGLRKHSCRWFFPLARSCDAVLSVRNGMQLTICNKSVI